METSKPIKYHPLEDSLKLVQSACASDKADISYIVALGRYCPLSPFQITCPYMDITRSKVVKTDDLKSELLIYCNK